MLEKEKYDYFKIEDNFKDIARYPAELIWGECSVEKPFVTIAIPTYKRSKTLIEALESAINQDIDIHYDIIIIDNNPERDDETEIALKKYKTINNIRYYKNSENIGMAGNWSRCYELSQSEWVIMLHDDDMLTKTYLKELLPFTKKKDIDAIFVKMNVFIDGTKPTEINDVEPLELQSLSLYDWFLFPCFTPSGHIIKKDEIIRLGGFSPKNFAPDIFFAKLIVNSKTYIANKKLLHYRKGINESTKLEAMEKMCELNHDYRIQAWHRMGFHDILCKKALLYSDLKFEEGFQRNWNPNFKYKRIPSHSSLDVLCSKVFYKILKIYSNSKSRILRKKLKIS